MKQKPIRVEKEKTYEDIVVKVGTFEGYPIESTITAEEQKEFIESGYGSLDDLVDSYMSYKDWQTDC